MTSFDQLTDRRGSNCVKWDEAPQPDVIPMWVADMDFQAAPAIREALRRRVEHGIFGYNIVPESYYESIINWFGRRHRWTIERQWLQYTTGVVPALSAVVKAMTEPGDQVVLLTPVYNCFFSSVRNNKCELVECPLLNNEGRYTIDYDALEHLTAASRCRLLVFCNPHNPVGRVWTEAEISHVNDICRRNGVIVVSDEIHNELVFDGRYVPFGRIDMSNTIVLTSPSKSFNTAGLQIANIVCSHPEWQQRIDRAINDNEVCDVNPFGIVALQAAYNESEAWMDDLCRYLKGNYEALCRFFAAEMPQLRVTPMEGTYLVWVDIRATGLSSDALTERLLTEGKVWVNSGTMYGSTGEGFIRINIATPRQLMMEGLRRMKGVVHSA